MDIPGALDDYDAVSLIHINNIEFLPAAPATAEAPAKPD